MTTDNEKAKLAAQTIHEFFQQFGEPDNYNRDVLRILFEELLNVPTVSLLGKQEEKGVQGNHPPQGGQENTNPNG